MRANRNPTLAAFAFVAAAAILSAPHATRAEGEESYFTAIVGPLGSMSKPGQDELGVYLRWDIVEGEYPGDLTTFFVERDGVQIYKAPAQGAMTATEIKALYSGEAQDRRRKEIVRWLAEEAQAKEPPDPPVTEANFPAVLRDRLLSERYWALFASRHDFNVARAAYRGFVDTPPPGNHTYELLASNDSTEVRIGLIRIDTSVATVLPPPADLVQVVDLGRCDAPERYRDHGSVALNWDHPGAGAGDKYVAALLTAGYDVFRSTENVAAVDPTVEMRALAAARIHDGVGQISYTGLEKVNDQPIVISGSAQKETSNQGWNPPFSQWLEPAADLATQGLAPGDTRAYYLVARDFTGNYGATARVLVTVPDTVAPPAPWAIRAVRDPAAPLADQYLLEWDQVDVLNFFEAHQGRTYCNLATARFDGKLDYVPAGENCDSAAHTRVDLRVQRYLVYRFDTATAAANFTDADGDGRADAIERVTLSADPPLSDPGSACDASVFPAGPSYLVHTQLASTAKLRSSGRRVMEFKDPVPAVSKGTVFWYRLAAVDLDGNISALSAPFRGFFPDRNRPRRCGDGQGPVLGERICTYDIVAQDPKPEIPYATDTTGDAATVRTSCERASTGTPFELDLPITVLPSGERGAELDRVSCDALRRNCNDLVPTVSYLSPAGVPLASEVLNRLGLDAACSEAPRTLLRKDCTGSRVREVRPGSVVSEDLRLDCPTAPDQCLNIYRDIGGRTYRYKTFCPPFPSPLDLDLVDIANLGGGDQICLSAAIQNQNNEVSSKFRLPCFRIAPTEPPKPPQAIEIGFEAGTANSRLTWLPPEQPVTGSIVEWFLKGEDDTGPTVFNDFFPHAGQSAADGSISVKVQITPEPGGGDWEQQWCFRARSVGHGGGQVLSEWSGTRCGLRVPEGVPLPEYIPWPKIATPPQVGGLLNRYLALTGIPVLLLTDGLPLDLGQCEYQRPPPCRSTRKDECVSRDPEKGVRGYCPDFCAQIRESVGGKLGFVAYRQSSSDPANASLYGDYVQISPLIDKLYCGTDFRFFPTTGQAEAELRDPFIKLADFVLGEPDWDGLRLVFADAYPHIAGRWYRYQLVYFDPRGEIVGHRQTDWFQAK